MSLPTSQVVPAPGAAFRMAEWEVDPATLSLRRGDEERHLEPKVMDVLSCLTKHAGEVVSKEALLDAVWPGLFVEEIAVARSISELRKALGDDARSPRLIATVPRRGYRLLVPVTPLSEPPVPGATESPPTIAKGRTWPRVLPLVLVFALLALLFWRKEPAPTPDSFESLVVLPLENLGESDEAYLAAGLTDALTGRLSRIQELRVVSGTTARQYARSALTLPEIARQLGVEAAIEGTVQRSGSQVRIGVHLVEMAGDRHLWSETYEGTMDELFALQTTVAQAVASHVRARLTPQEEQALALAPRVAPKAYEAYLRGVHKLAANTAPDVREAISLFRESIEHDPEYGWAWSGLANAWWHLGQPIGAEPPTLSMPRAREAALRALEIDETIFDAHSALGYVHLFYDRDWQASEASFRRAVAVAPDLGIPRFGLAYYLSVTGRHEAAIAEARRAVELEPLHHTLRTGLAEILFNARRYAEARAECDRVLEWEPQFDRALKVRDWVFVIEGGPLLDFSDGSTSLQEYLESRLLKIDPTSRGFERVRILAQLGRRSEALDQLDRAVQSRQGGLVLLGVDPFLDPLREEPRFLEILGRLEFPTRPKPSAGP